MSDISLQLLPGPAEARTPYLGDPNASASTAEPLLSPKRGIFFTWVFPLLRRAVSVERLESTDLFTLEPEAEPEVLYNVFITEWRNLRARRGARPRRLLLRVLARVHFWTLVPLWLGRFIQAILGFSFPLFLNLLIKYVAEEKGTPLHGLVLAGLMFLAQVLSVLIDNNVSRHFQSLGLRIRASMIVAIFRKVIVLRQDALSSFSTGKLNNLITTDVNKARRVVRYFHFLLLAPIQIAITVFSLHHLMGSAVFIGFGWMAFVILLNPMLMHFEQKLDDKQQSMTDERVRKATEVISAIQIIKCYAWERPATASVEEARRVELLAMWRLYCLYTIFEALWSSIIPITTAVTFASYTLLNPDDPLTPAQAFTTISLMNMVQDQLFTIPWALNLVVESLVATKRMERLFFLPELRLPCTAAIPSFCEDDTLSDPESGPVGPVEAAVEFSGQSFRWPPVSRQEGDNDDNQSAQDGDDAVAQSSAPSVTVEGETREASGFTLADLRLRVPRGALVAVVGATASGKTSLLQAILGEMPPVLSEEDGDAAESPVSRTRPIGFASQQPWVFNATVKENILFGEPFSEKRYNECVQCCALEKDLSLLKFGDNTKVGEKGIALSGGQKARICLARAAYCQGVGNIFVLDDPYSALDAHVAQKVHDEAVLGLLAKKTRVVATNRLEFVSDSDLVIVMESGHIEASGSFAQVKKSSSALRALLVAQGLETEVGEDGVSSPAGQPSLGRQISSVSYKSAGSHGSGEEQDAGGGDQEGNGDADQNGEEEEEEARESGGVKKEVIFYYLAHMGGCGTILMLVSAYFFSELIALASPIWLSYWTSKSPGPAEIQMFLVVYSILSASNIVCMTLRDMLGNILGFRAARRLHREMLASVVRAPMSFFQDTPQGRIINRFSKDTSEIDKDLVWQMIYTVVPVLDVIGNFAMVGGIAYYSLLAFSPVFWLYYKCWKYYNKTAMDLKRISKVASSPVYDHFNNLCRENAMSIVRAHQQVMRQCGINIDLVAEQQRPEYSILFSEMWFCMCVENLGCLLVFFVTVLVVLGRGSLVSGSTAGLVITFAGQCSGSIQSLVGQIAEFGMAFNCVERVKEYATTLPSEALQITDHRPDPRWPSTGVLEVQDLRLRYRAELELVLKGISFATRPGEHLGIVGRTGAGKSSLLLAILRIAEPEPNSVIRLDGEDLLSLGLEDVRSNIAMIPQEPVLFQASLRYNCDPFARCSSNEVWNSLEEAQLVPWICEQRAASDASGPSRQEASAETAQLPSNDQEIEELLRLEISEGGQNLSAGQRQMVAIARAVLRKSQLVVLDEATAAIDASTDAAIQLAVRRCFEGATTLTIAHRLQTILCSDRVMVLSDGEVAEIGPPSELLAQEGGIFASMVEEAGL